MAPGRFALERVELRGCARRLFGPFRVALGAPSRLSVTASGAPRQPLTHRRMRCVCRAHFGVNRIIAHVPPLMATIFSRLCYLLLLPNSSICLSFALSKRQVVIREGRPRSCSAGHFLLDLPKAVCQSQHGSGRISAQHGFVEQGLSSKAHQSRSTDRCLPLHVQAPRSWCLRRYFLRVLSPTGPPASYFVRVAGTRGFIFARCFLRYVACASRSRYPLHGNPPSALPPKTCLGFGLIARAGSAAAKMGPPPRFVAPQA